MDRITQEAYYRQRVLKYAAKHGVTRAAERYRMSRKTVHKWKRRYDGTVESLKNRSRAPLHSPLKQSDWEIQLVQRYAKKYPRDLLLGYEKAQKILESVTGNILDTNLSTADMLDAFNMVFSMRGTPVEMFRLPVDGTFHSFDYFGGASQLMEFAPNREALRDFLFSSDFIVTE